MAVFQPDIHLRILSFYWDMLPMTVYTRGRYPELNILYTKKILNLSLVCKLYMLFIRDKISDSKYKICNIDNSEDVKNYRLVSSINTNIQIWIRPSHEIIFNLIYSKIQHLLPEENQKSLIPINDHIYRHSFENIFFFKN
jgi:hypothetical protein